MARKKDTMTDILRDPNKLAENTRGVEGILATLFRSILRAEKISHTRWEHYMRFWLQNPSNRSGSTGYDASNDRGNINRALFDSIMSWKTFFRGLLFLRYRRMRITIELERHSGGVTMVQQSVLLSAASGMSSDTDEATPSDNLEHWPVSGGEDTKTKEVQ